MRFPLVVAHIFACLSTDLAVARLNRPLVLGKTRYTFFTFTHGGHALIDVAKVILQLVFIFLAARSFAKIDLNVTYQLLAVLGQCRVGQIEVELGQIRDRLIVAAVHVAYK